MSPSRSAKPAAKPAVPSKTVHPIVDLALGALKPGQDETFALDGNAAASLVNALAELHSPDKLAAALTALLELAHQLETAHKSPTVARALLRLASVAADPLKAAAQTAAGARKGKEFNKFLGDKKAAPKAAAAPAGGKKLAAASVPRRA